MRRRVFACLLAMCATIALPRLASADLPSVFAGLQPSLVFIDSGNKHGTGFVVASGGGQTTILTAYHVVSGAKKIAVNINNDPHVAIEATIVKTNSDDDLALISVRRGGLTPVHIGAESPPVGSSIVVAGYPPTSIQFLESQNELKPEIATGTITAVRVSGTVIQHSAASESGDSGGPLFLADSGDVVGVVKGRAAGGAVGYVAIGSAAVRAFLQSANVSFDNGVTAASGALAPSPARAAASSLLLQDAPGARRFCAYRMHGGTFVQSPNGTINGNLDYGTPVEDSLVQRLQTALGSTITQLGNDPFGNAQADAQRVAQLAKSNGCVGVIRLIEQWKVDDSLAFSSAISAGVGIAIFDFRGDLWYTNVKTKDQHRVFAFLPTDVQNVLNDLANQALAPILADLTANDGSVATNFARYGIPIPSGAKRAFFTLAPGTPNAVVSSVYPIGSAAQAGLQRGDSIVSVNGTPTAGLDAAHLTDLVTAGQSWDLVVHGADGLDVHVRFDAQDIRWYLQHGPKV